MDARDISAIGNALAEGLDGAAQRVEEIHQALADRSFKAAGPARRLPQRLHDRVAARVYATVRTLGPAAVRSSAIGLGAASGSESVRVHSSPRGKAIVSAFNGAFGDGLARRRNGLALPMAIRIDGEEVRPTPESLAQSFPDGAPRIAVFVHGLGETDDSWRWYAQANWKDPDASYGELLRRERGYTPIYVHYNSGRELATNGGELSALLEAVVDGWPVPVRQLVLVGHSAGALVARAAVRAGVESGAHWVRHTDHLFTLGIPLGAIRAERASQAAGRALSRLPETRPLVKLLDARSAGLKDLRTDPAPLLPLWVKDVRLPEPDDPGAARSSEAGRRAGRRPGGIHVPHFKLLNHPIIYEQLKARLSDHTAPGRARVAPAGRYGLAARALRGRTPSRRR